MQIYKKIFIASYVMPTFYALLKLEFFNEKILKIHRIYISLQYYYNIISQKTILYE